MAVKTIIAIGVTGGLLYMAYKKSLPRGVRNNNPLNIRESKGDKTQWKGEAVFDTDKAFEEFKNPVYGFRAGARVLRSYQRQGINTLTGIIHRFAPSHENDTSHYINQVSKWTGYDVTQPLNLNNDDVLANVLYAMSKMEVGNYFTLKTAKAGVAIA